MTASRTSASWADVGGAVLGLTVLLSVLLTAFAWPAANSEPRDVPIAVAAPAPVAAKIEAGLASGLGAAAFDVSRLADRPDAVAAIRDRDVYGAIVVGPRGAQMLTASAASPAVAQILGQMATRLPADPTAAAAGPVQVTDVVPLP